MSKEKLKNKGITLIALIITIIVMLILVAVTLSVTLGDNGLITKAREAKIQTEIAMDKELLLSSVVGAIGEDGKVDFSKINLPENFTGSNGVYISSNGYTFNVSPNGSITYVETEDDNISTADLELLRTYFLGEFDETTGQRPGKNMMGLVENAENVESIFEVVFKNDETISDAYNIEIITLGEVLDGQNFVLLFYLTYNNHQYILKVKEDLTTYELNLIKNETISIVGKYYFHYNYEKHGDEMAYIEIYDDYTYDCPQYNERGKVIVNSDNKTIALIRISEVDFNTLETINVEDYNTAQIFNYGIVYENGEVANVAIYGGNNGEFASINKKGFKYNLDGTYMNDEGDEKLIFDSTTGTVDLQYKSSDNNWGFPSGGYGRDLLYFIFEDICCIDANAWNISTDLNTIFFKGEYFIKQAN